MSQHRVRILITTWLPPDLVQRIADFDTRLEVIYPEHLIPAQRYAGDHALPVADTLELRQQWRELLASAEILFDFGPALMTGDLASLPSLRWIQASSAGVGQFAVRVGLTKSSIIVTTASGIHARPIAEFVLMAILMFVKDALRLAADQRAHRWERYASEEVAGKTVGIVGAWAAIGREIARPCASPGCQGDRHGRRDPQERHAAESVS